MMRLDNTSQSNTASSPVRVAINSQINPDTAGGVESSATSIMRYYNSDQNDVELTVLSLPEHVERYRQIIGPRHHVAIRNNAQERQIFPDVSNPWLKRFQARSGKVRPAIDAAILAVKKRSFQRSLGTAADNDRMLAENGIEAVHFPYGSTFPTNLPFVFEPHDIQHRHHPEFFHPGQITWRDRVYGNGCRNAAMVVCGSRWTKMDIMNEFGVPSERIAVIPRSSYNARFVVEEHRRREILVERELPEQFAYYPAMTFPHKNHIMLFEALASLRDDHGIILPLVMTGRSYKPHHPELLRALKRLRLTDQVHLLGVVPEEVLSTLFLSAQFMIFPSLFEGLSQSLLEGLHVGLPIVAAKQTSIPETVGDAAILFDGEDLGSMVAALKSAVSDRQLLASIGARAPAYYERYSWDRAGPMLTAVYRHITKRTLSGEEEGLLHEALKV